MKKLFSIVVSMFMLVSLSACNTTKTEKVENTTEQKTEDKVKVALLLPYIGDQSYFDVTHNSFKLIEEKYGDKVELKLVEMGSDESGWESANLQAAQEGYDVIISGNFLYEAAMLATAKQYPDITYINFDYSDAEANNLPNVYGVRYKSEEIGYLAGVVAAVKTETNKVGAIGGMEFNGIKSFLGGFIQGALAVNPEIEIETAFVGDFTDTGKMKEIALNMNKQGADVIFHAAGGAGNGLFEAAAQNNFYAIGVDTDQYTALSSKPELANTIITSGVKKCDYAILDAIDKYMESKLPLGTLVSLGYAENGVGLAENDQYKKVMGEEGIAKVEQYINPVKNKEVEIIDIEANPDQWEVLISKIAK